MGTDLLYGGKRPESKVDYTLSSSVEVKNEWNYTSGPLHASMAWARTSLP